jgi:hypothetical protein
MSDRLYLIAIPVELAARAESILDTPIHLEFQPYVEDGVLYTSGWARPNPDYWELIDWLNTLPNLCLARWPGDHLAKLFWKWSGQEAFKTFAIGIEIAPPLGEITPPCPAMQIETLLRKHVDRAAKTGGCYPNIPADLATFLAEHADDHLLLYVS